MTKLTAEWVRKAEVDDRGARQLARSRFPMPDLVCFHWQQAAEKYRLSEASLTAFGTRRFRSWMTQTGPFESSKAVISQPLWVRRGDGRQP